MLLVAVGASGGAWLGSSLSVGRPGWRLDRLATMPFLLHIKTRVYVKLNLFVYANQGVFAVFSLQLLFDFWCEYEYFPMHFT